MNNNVLDLMKSYNAERKLRKAYHTVIAMLRFKKTINLSRATSGLSWLEESGSNSVENSADGSLDKLSSDEKAKKDRRKSSIKPIAKKMTTSTKSEKSETKKVERKPTVDAGQKPRKMSQV